MLFEVKENALKIDGDSFIENLRFNLDSPVKKVRLKLDLCCTDSSEPISLDLLIKYDSVKFSLPATLTTDIMGEELENEIEFKLCISFNLLKKKWTVKGEVDSKKVDTTISSINELTTLVKSTIS